jgi:Recombination endonuclease VII
MLEKQKCLCALCLKPLRVGARNKRFAVDHCHATNQVRGLLCTLCNIMLGRYDDDPARFERVIAYLKGEL